MEGNLQINQNELAIGGDIPVNRTEKDQLINRLRLFINKLNDHLETSEGKRDALKQEYSKKENEVKESEELVRQLTGQITEQAVVVSEQMREVQVARESAKKPRSEHVLGAEHIPKNQSGVLPQIAEEFASQPDIDNGTEENSDDLRRLDEILQKRSFPGFTYKLTIKKPPLGFTVMRDDSSDFVKVESVARNDLKKAGLEPGLQILDVNNVGLRNKTAKEVIEMIKERMSKPVEIRMRKALSPWETYLDHSITSWGTTKAKTTWTFYCARNKPRIVVLEHNQRKGKAKRKVVVDGEIRYERKSTQETFKINLESDVLLLKIEKGDSGYKYSMDINKLPFAEARASFIKVRTETMRIM